MKQILKPPVRQFLLKALIIYILWYILYDLWMLPDGSVDYWLSHNMVVVSSSILHVIGYHVFAYGRNVGISGTSGIRMLNGCNGLSTIGLFLGFIIAFPGDHWKRLWFSLAGILIIYLTNVMRITILTLIIYWKPSYFNVTHEYTGSLVYYSIIFVLWMIWANYGRNNRLLSQTVPSS